MSTPGRCPLLYACLAFTGFLLAACSDPVDAPDPARIEAEIVRAKLPLFIHYAMLPAQAAGEVAAPDREKTASLIVPGAENVLVSTTLAPPSDYAFWTKRGGKIARKMEVARIGEDLAAGRRDPIARHLEAGFDYVALDELEPGKAAHIADARPEVARAFANLLAAHRGKVILYVNSYNMAGTEPNELAMFRTVLAACREHCLALASENYLSTAEAFVRGAASPAGCANGLDCIGWTAARLEDAAPGIGKKIVTVLDVRGRTEPKKAAPVPVKPAADERSFCGPPGSRGALQREIAKARMLGQRGVGLYALPAVANDVDDGALHEAAVARFASCFRSAATFFTPGSAVPDDLRDP